MLDADNVTPPPPTTPDPGCLERISMSAVGLPLADAATPVSAWLPAELTTEEEWMAPMVFIFWVVWEFVLELEAVFALRNELRVPEGLSNLSLEAPLLPLPPLPPGGGRGKRRLSQAWRKAWLGDIRVTGSQSKHRRMKSKKSGSSQPLSAVWSSRDPGGPRGLPLRDRPPLRTVVLSGSVVTVQ